MSEKQTSDQPSKLHCLFEVGAGSIVGWNEDDFGEIFLHQLRTPLLEELTFDPEHLETEQSAKFAPGVALKTFGDLLRHPSPPLKLLQLTKEFAKKADRQSAPTLPPAIASALYLLAIAVALLKHRKRITSMSNLDLLEGLKWVFEQKWIEEPMRVMAKQALGFVSSN